MWKQIKSHPIILINIIRAIKPKCLRLIGYDILLKIVESYSRAQSSYNKYRTKS